MQPIIDVWFNKMHQILNDNTMFQVVSDLYTGVIPVQDNKPVIDQETYKKVLEKQTQEATQGQIESLQITGYSQVYCRTETWRRCSPRSRRQYKLAMSCR